MGPLPERDTHTQGGPSGDTHAQGPSSAGHRKSATGVTHTEIHSDTHSDTCGDTHNDPHRGHGGAHAQPTAGATPSSGARGIPNSAAERGDPSSGTDMGPSPSAPPVRRRAPPRLCEVCSTARAAVKRPKTGQQVCRECFFAALEEEVHRTIVENRLFRKGERVAIGASGGKDSTVLAHILSTLNARYGYGLHLLLLSIDEGISGYRDDSLETVKRNEKQYGIPLTIVSYKELYGWTMDDIVAAIGRKNNCTFCGVFRRQALDRGAFRLKADKLATGHNADDIAETVLLNVVRGDVARLSRCAAIVTGDEGALPRCKPFKYTYEKEIVMYAHFKKLDYFSTECIYSPDAYRGFVREYIKDLESIRPSAIVDVIRSAEQMRFAPTAKMPQQGTCSQCGYISSQKRCKACVLLEGLNRGLPRLGISRTRGSSVATTTS